MANHTVTATPLISLIRELRDETKALVKEEIQLAKTEVSEKASYFGKNGAILAIGGAVAYAGLIVFLAALGILIAFGLESAGLEPLLAYFAGLGIMGLLVIGTGAIFIFKALATFKRESMAPERTVRTLQHLAGSEAAKAPTTEPEGARPKRSSQDLQAQVNHTQTQVGERMEELSRRMTPHYMGKVVKGQVRVHPLRSVAVAFGTGLASAIMIARRSNHHART